MNRRARSYQCAACRYQGRRCDRNCRYAPYFPMSRYIEYESAHKLFGLANINKIMNSVEPSEREAAAESILAQGHAWAVDPVYGSTGIIRRLQDEIALHERELQIVNQHLEYYRRCEGGKPDPSLVEQPLLIDKIINNLNPLSNQASCEEAGDVESSNVKMVDYFQEDPYLLAEASAGKLHESSSEKEAFATESGRAK